VISRRFDQKEAVKRIEEDGNNAKDDDGNLFLAEADEFDILEVAHILPHSLTKGNANPQLACIVLQDDLLS
jgi:hypothetical protein